MILSSLPLSQLSTIQYLWDGDDDDDDDDKNN